MYDLNAGSFTEYAGAVGLALRAFEPIQPDASHDIDDFIRALADSESALGIDAISEAVWRVGWPAIEEKIGEIAREVHSCAPRDLDSAIARASYMLLGPNAPEDDIAQVSFSESLGMLISVASHEAADDTISGYRCVVTVYACGDSGAWEPIDAMESNMANAYDALEEASEAGLAAASARGSIVPTAPVTLHDAMRAIAGDGGAVAACASRLGSCGIDPARAVPSAYSPCCRDVAPTGLRDLLGNATAAARSAPKGCRDAGAPVAQGRQDR